MDALTQREQEVGFWLAQGKTNREIALIISTAAAIALHAYFSTRTAQKPGAS